MKKKLQEVIDQLVLVNTNLRRIHNLLVELDKPEAPAPTPVAKKPVARKRTVAKK